MMQKRSGAAYMRRMSKSSLLRTFVILTVATLSFAVRADDKADLPEGLSIEHPMLLIAGPSAKSAAAFLVIENASDSDDHLTGVEADFANTLQLHTHVMENDVAKMRAAEGGFVIAAGGNRELARGGDHIMIMGLKSVPVVGETVILTLIFEKAGAVSVPFMVMQVGQAGTMPHDHK